MSHCKAHVLGRIFHIYFPIFMNLCIIGLNISMLIICKFRENRRREGDIFILVLIKLLFNVFRYTLG